MIECYSEKALARSTFAVWRAAETFWGLMMTLHFFDPNATAAILYRRLPHWSQAGVVCFITFRLNDSMPQKVIDEWHKERALWLRQHGINPNKPTWQSDIQCLTSRLQFEFYSTFSSRWHEELDACHGSCLLSDSANSRIVADCFRRFDGDKYWLSDFVVMPNHTHLLISFPDDETMLSQCEAWKRFTGRQINQRLSMTGRFWQQDGFDHLVRSASQFEHFRRYIADNPRKARLKPGQYVLYSNTNQ
jgi:type I restriction enzyme R subunit